MYLSHIDTDRIDRAEQAAAFLLSFEGVFSATQLAAISSIHVDCIAELEDRKVLPRS